MSSNRIPIFPNMLSLMENPVADREKMLLGRQKDNGLKTGIGKYADLVKPSDQDLIKVQERKPLSEVLDDITMFRYGYVPFVIAELAWDYADTVIEMAIMCNNPKTKKLSRAIRTLRAEYERYHSRVVFSDGKSGEEENMYLFETEVSSLFSLYVTNIKCDLISLYSNIEENTLHLLVSVCQCLIVIKSLLRYSAIQTAKAQEMAGYPLDDVMPQSIRSVVPLINEFAGDMPVSDEFMKQEETYIKTFATQIGLIKLNLIDE